MSYQITQEQYRREWVVAFQRGETYLKDAVTKETMINGLTANFAVQGKADRMTQRGANGLIPSRNRTDTQPKATLVEKHSKETQTGFNVFTASADVREAMQNAGALTASREIDYTIIETLDTTTNDYAGSAAALTYGKVVDFLATLRQADVTSAQGLCCLWTPKAWARLLTFPEFTNADYVQTKKLDGLAAEAPVMWLGAMHIHHTGLTGMGTNDASCYGFAKPSVGHAIASGDIQVAAGYNDEDDYSYSRHTVFDGATILQSSGVLRFKHDDSAAFS